MDDLGGQCLANTAWAFTTAAQSDTSLFKAWWGLNPAWVNPEWVLVVILVVLVVVLVVLAVVSS